MGRTILFAFGEQTPPTLGGSGHLVRPAAIRVLREDARRRAHQTPDELWATRLYLHDLGRRLADLGGEREGWEANVRRSEAEGNERIRAWAR